ncbi:MAG: methionyl-tRNA formyltransferase [Nitrospinae bacterium]|nr:methionyl-tRNA formyltransferase [Nitrospinota bacterium]
MPATLSVVFMGTPDFSVPTLEALIGHPKFRVDAVVTQPDRPKGRGKKLTPSPVKQIAIGHGIPVLQPEKTREPENVARLSEIKPDYIVVVAYGQILPLSILQIPRLLPVNLHASLLPRWRGAAPIHRAFLAGDTVTGVCVMIMAEGLDTGDVLSRRKTEITEEDTAGRLHDRLARTGAVLMAETLVEYAGGGIVPERQDGSLATYAAKLGHADFIIDWTGPAESVSRKIRGLSPFPGAMTSLGGKIIKPLFAKVAAREGTLGEPGAALGVSGDGISVACGAGSVVITELKPEGKPAMAAHAFTLGHKVCVGDKFSRPDGL